MASTPANLVGDPGSIPGHARRDSYIVSLYGLDGLREHWTPGNRRTGKPATEKRAFANETEALAFIAERPHLQRENYRGQMGAYRCGVCGAFHIGRSERAPDPGREGQA